MYAQIDRFMSKLTVFLIKVTKPENDRYQHLNYYQQLELGSVQLGLGSVEIAHGYVGLFPDRQAACLLQNTL